MAAAAATVTKAGGSYEFATTQEHHLIDEIGMKGRRERLLGWPRRAPRSREGGRELRRAYHHVPKLESLFDQRKHRARTSGDDDHSPRATAATPAIARQSENNILIVGKEQVSRGRRCTDADRPLLPGRRRGRVDHGRGQPADQLPVRERAREQVCLVAATVHGEEGTNDMVYNRCIGTATATTAR